MSCPVGRALGVRCMLGRTLVSAARGSLWAYACCLLYACTLRLHFADPFGRTLAACSVLGPTSLGPMCMMRPVPFGLCVFYDVLGPTSPWAYVYEAPGPLRSICLL